MPALALVKPSRWRTMITPGRRRDTAVLSRRISSISRASLPTTAASSSARAVGVTSASLTCRPSALETIFWATAITSPSCSARPARPSASSSSAAKSSPAWTWGMLGRAVSVSEGAGEEAWDMGSWRFESAARLHYTPTTVKVPALVKAIAKSARS